MNEEKYYFAMPYRSKKYHVFKDKMSLCEGWIFGGYDEDDLVKGTESESKDDCKICFQKMKQIMGKIDNGN